MRSKTMEEKNTHKIKLKMVMHRNTKKKYKKSCPTKGKD